VRSTLALNNESHPVRRRSVIPVLGKLVSSSFAFVTIEGEFCTGTGLRCCVVKLPKFAASVDTTDALLDIKVRWWKPAVSTNASYGGKWVVWLKDGTNNQFCDKIQRGTIAVCPLELRAASRVTRPLDRQWLKAKTASTLLIGVP
jgi:hypothetical protein